MRGAHAIDIAMFVFAGARSETASGICFAGALIFAPS